MYVCMYVCTVLYIFMNVQYGIFVCVLYTKMYVCMLICLFVYNYEEYVCMYA